MTVSTFFPDGDPEDTSVDGTAERFVGTEPFATLRSGNGTTAADTTTVGSCAELQASSTTDEYARILRGFFLFDTSTLGDGDTIDSGTFDLVFNFVIDQFAEAGAIALVDTSPASNTAIAASDYENNSGTTRQASDRTLASLVVDNVTYNLWTLNAAGAASVSKTGITKLGTRINFDLDNSAPTWVNSNQAQANCAYADNVTAGVRPRLVITHTTPPEQSLGLLAGQMAGNAPHSFRTRMVGT